MIHSFSPFSGSNTFRLSKEARTLAFVVLRTPDTITPGEGPGDIVVGVNNFAANMINRVAALFPGSEAVRKQSQANLASEMNWLNAFERPDIFTDATRTEGLPPVLTPLDVLRAMPPAERAKAFFQFVREMLPQRLINLNPGQAEYTHPALQAADLNTLGPITPPTPDQQRYLLRVIALTLGRQDPTDVGRPFEERDARVALQSRYPANEPARLYNNYNTEIQKLTKRLVDQRLPVPSPDDLRSPEYLIAQLQGQPSTFNGWLQSMMAPGMDAADAAARRAEVVAVLTALSGMRQQNESKQKIDSLELETQRMNLRTDVAETVRQRTNTFSQNFATLEPYQQIALVGLGVFAMYKMWKSKYFSWVPPALLGTYVYMRLVNGDRDAFNTMTNAGKRMGQKIGDAIAPRLRTAGVLPRTPNEVDRQQLALMTKYMDQRAFMARSPATLPFMTLSEVPIDQIATSFSIQNGPSGYSATLGAPEGSPLYETMEDIIRTRKYDREQVYNRFNTNNGQISTALSTVFYNLAVRKYGRNDPRVIRVESARSAVTAQMPDGSMGDSYLLTHDSEARQLYTELVTAGMNSAITTHAGKPFGQVIAELMTETLTRPDTAENVTQADRDRQRPARAEEQNKLRANPLEPNRAPTIEQFKKTFTEFLDKLNKPGQAPLLNGPGRDRLNAVRDQIANSGRPLTEIQQTLSRLEYNVLIAIHKRGEAIPLDEAGVNDIVGPIDDPNPVTTIFSSVSNWFERNVVTVSSAFRNVTGIGDVRSMVAGRLFSGVEGGTPNGTFPVLNAELTATEALFKRLKEPNQVAEIFVNALDPATIARFGAGPAGRANAIAFARRMAESDAYVTHINNLEQSYAQGIATDLVEAMLYNHRNDAGGHAFTRAPGERTISPVEENNIVSAARASRDRLIGPPGRFLMGTGTALIMREHLSAYTPQLAAAASAEDRANDITHIQGIARGYMSLQPIPPFEGVDTVTTVLRARVGTVAQKFLNQAQAGSITNTPLIRSQLDDISDTMKLLNMDISIINSIRVALAPPQPSVLPPQPGGVGVVMAPQPGGVLPVTPPISADTPAILQPQPGDALVIFIPQAGNTLQVLPANTALPVGMAAVMQPAPGTAPAIIPFVPGQVLAVQPNQPGASVQVMPGPTPGTLAVLPAASTPGAPILVPADPNATLVLAHSASTTPFILTPPPGTTRLAFVMLANGTLRTMPVPAALPAGTTPFAQPQAAQPALDITPVAGQTFFVDVQPGQSVKIAPAAAGQWKLVA